MPGLVGDLTDPFVWQVPMVRANHPDSTNPNCAYIFAWKYRKRCAEKTRDETPTGYSCSRSRSARKRNAVRADDDSTAVEKLFILPSTITLHQNHRSFPGDH